MTAKFSEAWCYEMLRRLRWPNGMICPRCGYERVTIHSKFSRSCRRRYLCLSCRRTFTDLTGTPFARTNISLRKWVFCLDLIGSDMTTSEIAHKLGVKWDTSFYMQQRLSMALNCPEPIKGLISKLKDVRSD